MYWAHRWTLLVKKIGYTQLRMASPYKLLFFLLASLFGIRLALIPADPSITPWFNHDSAYIAIISNNLLAGRGFINDAHWLLLDRFQSLPVYFHNSNPLYPILNATFAALPGMNVVWAGAMVSIAGWLGAGAAVAWITWHLSRDFRLTIIVLLSVLFFPACLEASFRVLPDSCSTALSLWSLALLITASAEAAHRPDRISYLRWSLAGFAFGLAWLTRSSVMILVPTIFLWLAPSILHRSRWPNLSFRLILFAFFAFLPAIPWLWRNHNVFGSAFYSENTMALLMDYWSYQFHIETDQFWRTELTYGGFGDVLRNDPIGIFTFWIKGFYLHIKGMAASLSYGNKFVLACLVPGMILSTWLFIRSFFRHPLFLPSLATPLATFTILSIRGGSSESRYILLLWIWLASASGFAIHYCFCKGLKPKSKEFFIPASLLLLMLLTCVWRDVAIAYNSNAVDPMLEDTRQNALQVSALLAPREPVAHFLPYFFTFYSGSSSFSPLFAPLPDAVQFMKRFNARYLVLPRTFVHRYFPNPQPDLGSRFHSLNIDPAFWVGVLKDAPQPPVIKQDVSSPGLKK